MAGQWRRWWRRLVCMTLVVLLVPVGLGRLPAASACSCLPNQSDEQYLSRADVVFEGVVLQRIEPATSTDPFGGQADPITWRFDVTGTLKGTTVDPQDVISVRAGNLCGDSFSIGARYRIYARREGSGLSTGLCSGNRLLPPAAPVGYRMAAADGGVFAFGTSTFHGSAGGLPLVAPVVGITATPSGRGYWLAAADGGVFAYGDARFFGSASGQRLNAPVVGITASPTGGGYWLAAADGGVFAYGDARFRGSLAGVPLNGPVVDIAATGSGAGYWLLGIDGGVFAYGDAGFLGVPDHLGSTVADPVGRATGITASHTGTGYWISDGVALNSGFGDTTPIGATHQAAFTGIVAVARTSGSPQLVIVSSRGAAIVYNDASAGDLAGRRLNAPVVAVSS